jgi:hypothetical protein
VDQVGIVHQKKVVLVAYTMAVAQLLLLMVLEAVVVTVPMVATAVAAMVVQVVLEQP